MDKTLVLKAQEREQTGSSNAAKVRAGGQIPAVVYGHKQKTMAISLDAHSFIEGLHHGVRLFDVQMGDKREKLLLKDVQYDHLGKSVVHADLMRVNVSEKVKVAVPVVIKGKAKGTSSGGTVVTHMDSLEVECLVTEIPDSLAVSVKDLEIGQSLHVKDISLPAGVRVLSDPELLVAACVTVVVKEVEAAAVEEVPTAPEVITKGKAVSEEAEAAE